MASHELWGIRGASPPRLFRIDAPSRADAVQALRRDGVLVMEPEAEQSAAGTGSAPMHRWWRARRGVENDLFAEQLLTLLQAGLGPVDGLRALMDQAAGTARPVFGRILCELESGRGLADAMAHEGGFDALLVALVRASEHTSDLPLALQRYLEHDRQARSVRQRIVTASVYPAVLLIVGTLVLGFLLFHVVPRFSGVFAGMRGELPWAATWMLAWGGLVKAHGTALGLAAALLAAAAAAVVIAPGTRAAAARALMAQRHVGHFVRLVFLSRLFRALAMLLDGGIPIPKALAMASELLPAHLRPAAASALQFVNQGQPPSQALAAAGLTTPVADQLLRVGEHGGELARMLAKAASFHEGETSRAIERFMKALEPTLMALIGLAVGFVVIVMYLPIFELASAIG